MFKTWQLLHRWTCNNQQLGICLVCLPLDKVLLSKPKRRQLKKKPAKPYRPWQYSQARQLSRFHPLKSLLKINTWKYWKS